MKLVSIVFAAVLPALAALNVFAARAPAWLPEWLLWTEWLRWVLAAVFVVLALALLRRPGRFGGLPPSARASGRGTAAR